MDNNSIPTGRYCYRMGQYYVCTNDENIANVYFDIHQLLERDLRERSDYAFTMADMIVKLNRFLKETNQENSKLGKDVIERIRKAYSEISTSSDGITLARKRILACIEDIIILSGGVGKGEDEVPEKVVENAPIGLTTEDDPRWEIYDGLVEEISEISKIHEHADASVIHSTTEREQIIADKVNELIESGMAELYPMKACLIAANNWSTFRFARP